MELVTVRDLFKHTADYVGKTVSVGGWVRSVRASKTFGFIVLSDGIRTEAISLRRMNIPPLSSVWILRSPKGPTAVLNTS